MLSFSRHRGKKELNMDQAEAIKLINKYIHDELSESELKALLVWLERPKNKRVFENQIEINYLLHNNKKRRDLSEAYSEISKFLAPAQKKKTKWKALLKYAAIFIGLLSLGFYFFNLNQEQSSPDYKAITLEMEDGGIKTIDQENQRSIVNKEGIIIGIHEEDKLKYNKNASAEKLIYNSLYVPKGKTFELVLSDGTQITLNSDSKITYPVSFVPGKKREVSLEGEACFQVTKDSLRQFVVSTKEQEIKVYGTTFNVKAYNDQTVDQTVLVEGSVGVSGKGGRVRLVPGEMASARDDGSFEVKKVNPENYTAWTRDEMVFQAEEFEEIIKTLERKFDVRIENKYTALNHQKFTAAFKDKELEQILKLFTKSRAFEFDKDGKQITIRKPEK